MVNTTVAPTRDAAQVAALLDSSEIGRLIADLDATRWTGRPGYPIRTMVGAALVKSVYCLPTWTRTVRLIAEHAALREAIGGTPSIHAAYRFTVKLREHGDALAGCIDRVLAALRDARPEIGRTVAIDGSDMPAYANGQRYVSKGGKLRERYSDPDAIAVRGPDAAAVPGVPVERARDLGGVDPGRRLPRLAQPPGGAGRSGAGGSGAGAGLSAAPGGLGPWLRHRGLPGARRPRLRGDGHDPDLGHHDGGEHPVPAGPRAGRAAARPDVPRALREPDRRHRARRGRVRDHPIGVSTWFRPPDRRQPAASRSSASTIVYAYPCSARNRCRCAAYSWSRVSRATTV